MTQKTTGGFSTRAIHHGYDPLDNKGALVPPLYTSATFAFPDTGYGARCFTGEESGYVYTRIANPTLALLASLQAAATFPLAIDESTHLLDTQFFRHPPVRRLVIKPSRHGGLLASAELALRARASGLETVITSALESACGIATLAHLAATVAPDAVHGLATADWLAGDTGLSPPVVDGWMRLPKGHGIGFVMAGEIRGGVAT